ncbi:hypothetical protein [Exiguobacterium sp. ZWU0009]|uniref:hypothetical protein n=1 Tax=Exiguobacterium sp. ZWU0009 TaxID=1224749 RepID=UPI000646AFC2|nr:hypothetical protein [Exiguobacterium sp. ZWU0009]
MANEKLSELYKVNDIELKEVVKPDSVTFENGRYHFKSLDNYFESKSGFQEFAQSISDKVAEAKIAADIAKARHQETVAKNMMGNATKQDIDKSRSDADRLELIAKEMKDSELSALHAYYQENDPRKMVEEYKKDVVPYFQYKLSVKEIAMAKARKAYLESVEAFFDEMQASHGILADIKDIRRGVGGIYSPGKLTHATPKIIEAGAGIPFPYELLPKESQLIESLNHRFNEQTG